jgi:YidC/Oxa1 family membrane protein insertase
MMQTQRTILWVIFTMSLFLLWDAWRQHNGDPGFFGPAPQQQQQLDSNNNTGAQGPAPAATAAPGSGVPQASAGAASSGSVPVATPSAAGSTAPVTAPTQAAGQATADAVVLQNDLLALSISPKGGVIERAELLTHRDRVTDGNIVLFSKDPSTFYLAQNGVINAPAGSEFVNHHSEMNVVSSSANELVLAASAGGLAVERTYRLEPGSYVLTIEDKLTNESEDSLSPVLYRQLTRNNHIPAGDDSFYIRTFVGPVIYNEQGKFQKIDFEDIDDGDAEYVKTANDGWAGMLQHYFASAIIPADNQTREYYTNRTQAGLYSVGMKLPLPALGANQTISSGVRMFIGPQDQRIIGDIAPGLDLTVDYGIFTVICQPLYWLLEKLHSIVGNWGWAIVLLTLIIKTIFFPLQAASYKSMARMKAVGPRLQQLKERYGDDRQKMNAAMMELYKNEKINPLGGCLPILVQIPVFISLYWVLLASVEMRDAPWIGWIQDLQAQDPYYILPLLMAISMFVQVKLSPAPPDPIQAKVMMFMPLVFSVFFFFFPAGLVLYWLVNNLYSIAQQWVITRKIVGNT